MATGTPPSAILLATDLAPFEIEHALLRPIITQTGGIELGTAADAFIASYPENAEGVAHAIECAKKLKEVLAGRYRPATAIHVGVPENATLSSLISLRSATEPGGIYISDPALTVGGGSHAIESVPVAPQTLRSAGSGLNFTVSKVLMGAGYKTGLITRPLKPAVIAQPGQVPSHPQALKTTPGLPAGPGHAPTKAPGAAPESRFNIKALGSRILELIGPSTSSITLKVVVAAMTCAAVLVAIRAKRDFYSGKEDITTMAAASSGNAATPPAAAASAAMPPTGSQAAATATTAAASSPTPATATPPAATAPQAAAPSTAVPAPPPAAPAAPVAAGAAPAAPAPSAAMPAPTPASSATNPAPVTASSAPAAANPPPAAANSTTTNAAPATAAAASGGAEKEPVIVPEIEARLLKECNSDGPFCLTTGIAFSKENAPAVAAKFFERGCGAGLGEACLRMGQAFHYGSGLDRSDVKAADFFIRGCEFKNAEACTELGIAFWRGRGVPRSPARASQAFEVGCANGNADACLVLGLAAQKPQEGNSRAPAAAHDFLTRGCQMLNLSTCTQ